MTESKQGIFKDAFKQSFYKLSPRLQVKNPVMFVVYLGALVTSGLYVLAFSVSKTVRLLLRLVSL